jgi:hypothetical protein
MPDPDGHNEAHYRWPKLTIYRAAVHRRFRFAWNRYEPVTIGAAVQVGGRVFSLTWANAVWVRDRSVWAGEIDRLLEDLGMEPTDG